MKLIGDLALTGLFTKDTSYNSRRIADIKTVLNNKHIATLCNLECPIYVENCINKNKNFIHTSDKTTTQQILKALNISCVSLANNHIYDCTMPGLKATIDVLDEIGVLHTGAGWKKEHITPVIFTEENKKVAFMAYVDHSTNPKTEGYEKELFINFLEVDKIISDINSVKQKVDEIVISLHWGTDYSFFPTPKQREVAKTIIDAGASIIMGHHPHTIQPYEKYKNGVIFYSLGGLTFGDFMKNGELTALFKKTKRGLIARYNLNSETTQFIGTKELKGNYIRITKFNYKKWSEKYWRKYHKRQSSKLYFKWTQFQEKIIDRTYEYFFGYYKSPIKRLFQFKNLTKIKRLFTDYKQSN